MEHLPDEVLTELKEYIIFKSKTKNELQNAVDIWCINKDEALIKYSHISLWNTSLITSMMTLFSFKNNFNDDRLLSF